MWRGWGAVAQRVYGIRSRVGRTAALLQSSSCQAWPPMSAARCSHKLTHGITSCTSAAAAAVYQVGYFWLTNGLAFTPLNGSALYIDVRLVPHCSDPCTVYTRSMAGVAKVEGRYGKLCAGALAEGRRVVEEGLDYNQYMSHVL